jgi:hypothetical protein
VDKNPPADPSPGPREPKLMHQVIQRLRCLHYSLRTEEAYVY